MNRKFQKCQDAILAISQEVAQITSRCIYPYPMVGTDAQWNTTIAEGTVLEGLEATDEVVARNPDIIEQILTRLDNVTEIPQEKVSSAVEEYMAKNPINIPKKLPNPHKLTFAGAVTAEYDGSGAVTVTIPEASGGSSGTVRVEKGSTDTTVELEPNKLYIFPEMASLTYTLAEPADASVANEYHFVFKSGSTATRVVHPSNVNIGNFSVESNKIYEVSILEGLLTSQNWVVS